jgi:hypothetical protein
MDPDAIALFHERVDRLPAKRVQYYAQHRVTPALGADVESVLRFDGDYRQEDVRGRSHVNDRLVTVRGVVLDFAWTNPHPMITLEVKNEAGQIDK